MPEAMKNVQAALATASISPVSLAAKNLAAAASNLALLIFLNVPRLFHVK